MALNISDFFTKAGLAIGPAKALNAAISGDFATKLSNFKNSFTTQSLDVQASADDLAAALISLRNSAAGSNDLTTATPIELLLRQLVVEDNAQLTDSALEAVAELIRQMEDASDTLEECTVTLTPTVATASNGALQVSNKDAKGKPLQFCFSETWSGTADGEGGSTFEGQLAVDNPLDPLYLTGGSGEASSLSVLNSDVSLLANGGFETPGEVEPLIPDGWVLQAGDTTMIAITNVEQQTVIISGTPTGGWYTLTYTDADGEPQTTFPIAFDADASAVAAALGNLVGLEDVSVETTGTAPDYTHTITFTNVKNPAQLTSDDTNLTGGTPAIAHATTTEASANVVRGSRSLQISSDGATVVQLRIPFVGAQPQTRYAFNTWIKSTLNQHATGELRIRMVDGSGTVVQDENAVDNSLTIDSSSIETEFLPFGATWRTPARLPATLYIEVAMTVAFDAGNPFWLDEFVITEPTELYTGGPTAALFEGPTGFALNDEFSLTVANDRAGEFVTWLDRIFGLRINELVPPTTTGVATILDSLIP